ncbi:unnamed protein product, partial [Mesorhabditis belari]|uniref:G-protein coupled receptors family 1 profile domain-containing protein n=1 Tax=Mesorhabditis belari TaxID=2138241 RepID=A0AAF3FPX6_9BILA
MAKLMHQSKQSSWHSDLWSFVTDIMATTDTNNTKCICSDLQTDDYSLFYAWYNYLLIIFALPTLSIFGVCTNIINLFIYSRRRMRNSANTYLLFLACSDFLVILTGLFIFWIDSARSYIPELARAPYTTVYTLPFGYMAQTCSIYFTVAAAVDCFVKACMRRRSTHYCTVKNAKNICYCITGISVLYNSLRFPQFNLRKCFHEPSQETIIEICPTTLFYTINTIYNVYMYMVLMTLLPFLFLLILNAIIVIRQSVPARPAFKPTQNGHTIIEPEEKIGGTGDDTITMIMVVVLFLMCNTLALFVNIYETLFEPDQLIINYLTDASNFLVILNSSVNCVIYFIFNKDYRLLLLKHAERVKRILRAEYFCCSTGERNTSYQPVSAIHEKVSQPSIQKAVPDYPRQENHEPNAPPLELPESPVWQPQPLTQQRLLGLEHWVTELHNNSINEPDWNCEESVVDSGWGDSVSTRQAPELPSARRWIAEVKIVEGVSSQRPHIVVKPLNSQDSISVTPL